MPKTYVPRATEPVIAIKLTDDLMAENGKWMVIGNDDKIVFFEDDQFGVLFEEAQVAGKLITVGTPIEPKTAPVEAPKKAEKLKKKPSRTESGYFTTQAGRFFYYLRSLGGKGSTSQISLLVKDPQDQNKGSVSAALGIGRDNGWATSKKVKTEYGPDRLQWTVTPLGAATADKYGVRCFTDHGLTVPPDAATPAVALAGHFKDRHNG